MIAVSHNSGATWDIGSGHYYDNRITLQSSGTTNDIYWPNSGGSTLINPSTPFLIDDTLMGFLCDILDFEL